MAASVRVKLSNPAILTWARETAGYSISDIASSLGQRESVVREWESGVNSPTFRQLERIAAKVKRPLSAFFLPDVPPDPPLPDDFRTMPNVREGQYQSASLIAFREARTTLTDVRELLDMLELDVNLSLPTWEIDKPPDELASRVRSLLGIGIEEQCDKWSDHYEALDMWRDVLFELGVISMVFPMHIDDARAFSLVEQRLGAVGVNSREHPNGRIFSLFHETCHLCLGKPGVSGPLARRPRAVDSGKVHLERYCDQFAASFLLPADDRRVLDSVRSVGADTHRHHVENLASTFKVSKYVMLRRALDLGHLSERLYWATYDDWQRDDQAAHVPAGGGDYVATRVSHIGKRVAALVFQALDVGQISLYDASKFLGLDPRHFGKARTRALGSVAYAR
jgi:Zn-dependent peptidase ImmA (M78 family)/transcriptional regulator with XRE-family HTH domain